MIQSRLVLVGGSSLWCGVDVDGSLICNAGPAQIFYGDNDDIDYIMNNDVADCVVLYVFCPSSPHPKLAMTLSFNTLQTISLL